MRLALLGLALGLATAVAAQPTVDGDLSDAAFTLLDDNAGGPAPGFGTTNYLNAIYAHVDVPSSTLYLGIAGLVEDGNRIVVFLDTRAGGYATADYGVGGPGAVANFNAANAFDDGFLADFAVAIGTDGTQSDYFVDVVELQGDRTNGPASTSRFIGSANTSADIAATPVGDATTYGTGFEIAIPFDDVTSPTGAALAITHTAISTFSVLTSDSGFLSNLTLTPAFSSQSDNFGFDAVDFGTLTDLDGEPVSNPGGYAWLRTSGRAGWRQISMPYANARVRDLALQNHVQGVTPSVPGTGSIPNGVDNLVPYGGLFGPAYGEYDTDSELLQITRGQFWYLYDTMVSDRWVPLPFTIQAGGFEFIGRFEKTNYIPEASAAASYLLGNPYFSPFDTAELSEVNGGYTLSNSVFVWDPDAGLSGMYREVDRSAADVASRTIPPMTGFWVDLVNPSGSGIVPEFRFEPAGRVRPAASTAPEATDRRAVAFELDLVDGADTYLVDRTTRLVFVEGAVDGADAFDAAEPPAISGQYARLSIVDGATPRAVLGRERDPEAVVTERLSFASAALGEQSYRLRWDASTLPADWRLALRDLATGETVDLRAASAYTFTAADGPAEDRFELVLTPAGVVSAEGGGEIAAGLSAPRPNPTAGAATVRVQVDRPQTVRVELFDALGRRVATAFDGAVDAGRSVTLDTAALAPGVYVVRATGETFAAGHRLTVTR